MIVKMKKYTFLVYHAQYEEFLKKLRDVGVLHISERSDDRGETEQLRRQMQQSARAQKSLKIAKSLLPEGVVLAPPKDQADALQLLAAFENMQVEAAKLQQQLATMEREQARLKIWGDFDAQKLQQLADVGYVVQCFSCPINRYNADWESAMNAFVVGQQGSSVYFVTINRAPVYPDADALTLGARNSTQLSADSEKLKAQQNRLQQQMTAWAQANTATLEQYITHIARGIDWQKVEQNTQDVVESTVKLLEGYCPEENAPQLNQMLEQEGIYYEVTNPVVGENIPVKLRNNFFARLFEPITELYSLPNYNEIDPTALFAPFFMLFFGLCMGDAGYGLLILALATVVKFKFPKWRSWATLGQFLGGATILAGMLTGTFFGIMLDSVSWPWLGRVKGWFLTSGNWKDTLGYDPMMLLAVALGVIQILFAMGVKGTKITIQYGFKYAASTFAWLVLFIVGMVMLLPMIGVIYPQPLWYLLYGIAGICVLVILFYNTPDKNPLINFGSGLYGTYNMASGVLGDVLSYIRLFALGLAGGILGNVFNQLALQLNGAMPAWIGWLPMLLVMLLGHGLNLFLCVISAVVHPMRLTFVEFYKNAAFEGGGTAYRPFR